MFMTLAGHPGGLLIIIRHLDSNPMRDSGAPLLYTMGNTLRQEYIYCEAGVYINSSQQVFLAFVSLSLATFFLLPTFFHPSGTFAFFWLSHLHPHYHFLETKILTLHSSR
jgi:hypothetical protein